MSYQVLARKYRPRTFAEVVGQTTVTRTLENALASGRVGHAFLFSGARGVGKTTTARILAKALNCARAEAATAEPCLECASCTEIAKGASLDVQEIDGATNNGVEQVRELRESARYNPARDRFKVWIIDEVHMLSTGAFNALLKTLEEPPPRVKFIFATTEYHKIPDTILSRCQQHEFRMIPARELQRHLREVADQEGIRVSDEGLARIARAAEGSARDALSLFDQVLSFSGQEVKDEDVTALLGLIDRDLLLAASRGIADADTLSLLQLVERLSDHGADYRNFLRELILHLREVLLVKVAPHDGALLSQVLPEERERLAPLAAAFAEEDLLRAFEVLTKADTDLRQAQDARVTLELALLKCAQLRRLVPLAELIGRMERLAGGTPPPPRAAAPVRAAAAVPERPPAEPRPVSSAAPAPAAPPPAEESVLTVPLAGSSLKAAILAACASRPSLCQPLRSASVTERGDTVIIEVVADWAAFASTHEGEYADVVRKAAGRPVRLELRTAEPAAEPPAPAPAEPGPAAAPHRTQLIEQAAREPGVQEALDLFNGKVVDVREGPFGATDGSRSPGGIE